MEKKQSVNAVKRVRQAFEKAGIPQTLKKIQIETGLEAPEVSMALCYLLKSRFVTRQEIPNPEGKGRASVWMYSYFKNKAGIQNAD